MYFTGNHGYQTILVFAPMLPSLLYGNFILNLYIVYELNNWRRNRRNILFSWFSQINKKHNQK